MLYSFPVAAVGTQKLITERQLIHTVVIDNASGMWLYVEEIQKYVPPNTSGWTKHILPRSNNIHLDYVAALSGGVASTVTGGPIVVNTYQIELLESDGTNYTVATQADVAAIEAQLSILNSNTGILNTPIFHVAALTFAGIVNLGILPPGSSNLATITVIHNPYTNSVPIWYADDSWGNANSVRSHGFALQSGETFGWVTRTTGLVLTTDVGDFSIRYMQGYVD